MENQLANAVYRRESLIQEAQIMRLADGLCAIMDRIAEWQCTEDGAKDEGLRQLNRLAAEALDGASAIEKELRR